MADASTLFVGQLADGVGDKDLTGIFDKYGNIVNVTIVRDRETGESKGFGFVQFETSTEANDAINGASGAEIKGAAISVEMSREKREPRQGGFRNRGMRNSGDSFRGGYSSRGGSGYSRGGGGGGYARGGYGRPREYNSDRMGGRSEGSDRGRGASRGPPRFAGNRHDDEGDRSYNSERRGSTSRYERQEERYGGHQENNHSDRHSSDRGQERRPERRPRADWHEEEYEEPRERRSSFGSRGGGAPRGGYNAQGRSSSSRGDYGGGRSDFGGGRSDLSSGRSDHGSRGGYNRGESSERGGFSRRGSDRGSYSGGGGQDRYASRSERPQREDNRDWYGASDRRSSDTRPASNDRYSSSSRHRDDDSGYRGRGTPRRPRGQGRGGRGGSYSGGRGSYGGSNRSFGEDY